ncbi:putative PurR-regulated permease PerM [Roseivirga ehrenbergii]|uniref:Permease n=1 Tax=Roseivirga ehrenbergii (strain DSM 102268 / JCM 13514 / KCTC 12282 / NCIMB 14502 / KMM 6017) TaxID=279360 RepID=A0A150XE84_ROSEK|nr:AI-2E family transporter [Roseivirga ehrenbergii]KYG77011.1 permease [Roseivirga ehrenbergii]TCL14489.1 putative PurR-regulated permease PerM [Roseivirga ehrenbergii]
MKRTAIYIALIIAALLLFIYFFTSIFTYLVLSLVLASILRPLVEKISGARFFKLKVPRWLAILMAFGAMILVLTLFVILFIPLIDDQISLLSTLDIDSVTESILEPIRSFEEFLLEKRLSNESPGFLVEGLRDTITEAISKIQVQSILNIILSFLSSFFVGLLALSFITFLLLYEKGLLRNSIIVAIPNKYFEVSIAALDKIEKLLSNYLLGLSFQVTVIFTMASIGLTIMGIKYSLTIALFAALANLIPYAGPLLGSAFGIIVGLSTSPDLVTSNDYLFLIVKVVSVFSVIQLTDNILLQPLIFSKSVKVHPLEIFVIIFAGASIAGISGMIAAIPAYTIIRVSVVELRRGYKQYSIFRS